MNNKEILAKNLKKELDKKNLTPTEFARIMKYPETTVFNWIHGKSYPRIDKIQEMSDYFNIYKSDLTEDKSNKIDLSEIEGIKLIKKFTNVPILGEIACGEPIFCQENYNGYFQIDEDLDKPDFCLRARGDSMIDVGIEDGDLIFMKQTPVVANGKIAGVLIDDTVTLKRFFKNENEIILQPENKSYSPIILRENDGQNIRIIGEMIGMYSKGSK